jgi:hypothetical protein
MRKEFPKIKVRLVGPDDPVERTRKRPARASANDAGLLTCWWQLPPENRSLSYRINAPFTGAQNRRPAA